MSSIEKTIVVTGPKRSGTTLLNRLFDNHSELIDVIDESFFWEHVYNHQIRGLENLFIDTFRNSDPTDLVEGMISRDLFACLNGVYSQVSNPPFSMDIKFSRKIFTEYLSNLKNCFTLSDIWYCLMEAYSEASSVDFSNREIAFIREGDWGKSTLATKNTLNKCSCIFIIRNPYSALDSLKRSRELRGQKILHPINFSQVLCHYNFFWKNKDKIIDERTILIRYEDLLTFPEKIMKKISSHVGISFDDRLLIPTMLGKVWRSTSSFNSTSGIDISVKDRKLQCLTNNDLELIGAHLRPILDYFDYKKPDLS